MSFFGLNQAALAASVAASVSASVGSSAPTVTSTLSSGTSGTYTTAATTRRVVLILQGAGADGGVGTVSGGAGLGGAGGSAGQYLQTTILVAGATAFPYSIAQRASSPLISFFGTFKAFGGIGDVAQLFTGVQNCFTVVGGFGGNGAPAGAASNAGLLAGQTNGVSTNIGKGAVGGRSLSTGWVGTGGSGGGSSVLGAGGAGGNGGDVSNVPPSQAGANATGFGGGGGGGGGAGTGGTAGAAGLGTGGVAYVYEYQG